MATLLTRSNAPSGAALIRTLGFSGSDAELFASFTAPDVARYEFAHIVLGAKGGMPPRALSATPGIRAVRDSGVTWIGGTFASWWRAVDAEDLPPRWRGAIINALTQVTNLGCFGNPKYLRDVPEWIEIPKTPAPGALLDAWGGIVSVSLDPVAEADFVAAGGRVLQRGGDGKLPWAAAMPAEAASEPDAVASAPGEAPAVTLIGGSLAWPFAESALLERDREALDAFEKAYRRVRAVVKSPAALEALRLPFEVSPLLMAIDGAVLTKAAGSAHPMTVHAAQQLRALFTPTPDAPGSKKGRGGKAPAGEPALA